MSPLCWFVISCNSVNGWQETNFHIHRWYKGDDALPVSPFKFIHFEQEKTVAKILEHSMNTMTFKIIAGIKFNISSVVK